MFALLLLASATLFIQPPTEEPLNRGQIEEACKSLVETILTEEPNGRIMHRSSSFKRKLRRSFPKKVRLCKRIARKALRFFRFELNQNQLALVAIAIAYRESQFKNGLVSPKGAIGPMQVIPHLWCDKPRCDRIRAGLLALDHYYRKMDQNLCRTLIRYNSGKGRDCKEGVVSYSYAQRVLSLIQKITPGRAEKLLSMQRELDKLGAQTAQIQKALAEIKARHERRKELIEALLDALRSKSPDVYAQID